MASLRRRIINVFRTILPKILLYWTYRRQIELPDLNTNDLIFKPAETMEEFSQAFECLQQCYLEKGYAVKSGIGMRITPYHLEPSTIVLIAKAKDRVVGTVSLILDKPFGLPIDAVADLGYLRKGQTKIAEVSSLAVQPDFRGEKGSTLHRIMRYFWKFSRAYLDITKFVCVVNPSMVSFYEAIYLFEPIPQAHPSLKYDFANGAPGVALMASVGGEINKKWERAYSSAKANQNLSLYINHPFTNAEFQVPMDYFVNYINPIPMPLLKLALHQSLEKISIETLFRFVPDSQRRRFKTHCRFVNYPLLRFENVSKSGFKVINTEDREIEELTGQFKVQLGPKTVSVLTIRQIWKSKNEAGCEVVNPDAEWLKLIDYLHESKVS